MSNNSYIYLQYIFITECIYLTPVPVSDPPPGNNAGGIAAGVIIVLILLVIIGTIFAVYMWRSVIDMLKDKLNFIS